MRIDKESYRIHEDTVNALREQGHYTVAVSTSRARSGTFGNLGLSGENVYEHRRFHPDMIAVARRSGIRAADQIREILRRHKPLLRKRFAVKEIGVFGSFVRGEESEQSDVDILVEFYDRVGWEFIDVREFLEGILGRKVDLVTVGGLKPQLRERILKEVVYA